MGFAFVVVGVVDVLSRVIQKLRDIVGDGGGDPHQFPVVVDGPPQEAVAGRLRVVHDFECNVCMYVVER